MWLQSHGGSGGVAGCLWLYAPGIYWPRISNYSGGPHPQPVLGACGNNPLATPVLHRTLHFVSLRRRRRRILCANILWGPAFLIKNLPSEPPQTIERRRWKFIYRARILAAALNFFLFWNSRFVFVGVCVCLWVFMAALAPLCAHAQGKSAAFVGVWIAKSFINSLSRDAAMLCGKIIMAASSVFLSFGILQTKGAIRLPRPCPAIWAAAHHSLVSYYLPLFIALGS